MGVSKMPSRGEPELCGISISASGMELSKAMSSVWPTMHKGTDGDGFGGNAREDIKGVSGNDIGEVRDHGNAVPGIGGFIGRGVNGQGGMRKSRGRVRT
jgi:hypothetical protein